MALEDLDKAIERLAFRPKGIKVGRELFKELYKSGRLTENVDMFCGMPPGVRGWFLDSDIYVLYDPYYLGDLEFELPSKSSD